MDQCDYIGYLLQFLSIVASSFLSYLLIKQGKNIILRDDRKTMLEEFVSLYEFEQEWFHNTAINYNNYEDFMDALNGAIAGKENYNILLNYTDYYKKLLKKPLLGKKNTRVLSDWIDIIYNTLFQLTMELTSEMVKINGSVYKDTTTPLQKVQNPPNQELINEFNKKAKKYVNDYNIKVTNIGLEKTFNKLYREMFI